MPCNTRAITSVVRLGASPHISDDNVNSAIEIMK